MNCVIVANGEFCTHKIPLDSLKNADFIIACDGAYDVLAKNNYKIDVVIGDLDSIKSTNTNARLIKINNQNTNDLTKAYKHALKYNFTNIKILAAGGKRDDHFIANIALISLFAKLKSKNKTKPKLSMQTNYGEFLYFDDDTKIKTYKTQQISIFCNDKLARFSSINLKYKLNNYRFKYLFSGTLNEATSDYIEIKNHDKRGYLIYLNY